MSHKGCKSLFYKSRLLDKVAIVGAFFVLRIRPQPLGSLILSADN